MNSISNMAPIERCSCPGHIRSCLSRGHSCPWREGLTDAISVCQGAILAASECGECTRPEATGDRVHVQPGSQLHWHSLLTLNPVSCRALGWRSPSFTSSHLYQGISPRNRPQHLPCSRPLPRSLPRLASLARICGACPPRVDSKNARASLGRQVARETSPLSQLSLTISRQVRSCARSISAASRPP